VSDPITIRDLHDGERAWANERYRDIQFALTPPEAVALVAELGGQRVGLGRLVEHAPDVVELGGIWTEPSMRGRGIARAMVEALMARLPARTAGAPPAPVWCIPFVHLSVFYQSFGFTVRPVPWPPAIAAKVAAIIAQGLPEVAVLAR
jgi:GNAT superfamily N-acetyltransferase